MLATYGTCGNSTAERSGNSFCVLQVCGHASDLGGAIPDSRLCIEQCGATADSCVGVALISSYNRPRPRISMVASTAFSPYSVGMLRNSLAAGPS